MKATNDLEFLSTYWIEAKKIAQRIKENLPKTKKRFLPENKSGKLIIIDYKDMDTWSVDDNLKKIFGKSKTLSILADKLEDMILQGRSKDIEPMIRRICANPNGFHMGKPARRSGDAKYTGSNDSFEEHYIGVGHFRWHYDCHLLKQEEIEHIKQYFKLY
jgi:hypothetical protein